MSKTISHASLAYKNVAVATAMATFSISGLTQQLDLNQLSSCNDLERVLNSLNHSTSGSTCGIAAGIIGRQIKRFLGSNSSSVCFLRDAPSNSLADFDCLRYGVGNSSGVVCYRAIEESAIKTYKQQYKERFVDLEMAYLGDAKNCSISNGDVSHVSSTMFPIILASVGEHQIGFASSIGKTRQVNAAAVHGFATASPDISRFGISAFEYFTVFRSTQPIATGPGELHGNWRLDIEPGDGELTKIMNETFRRAGVVTQIKVFGVQVERDIEAKPYPQSNSVTAPIAESIKTALIDEGFEEQLQEDIESATGIKGGDMMSAIKNRVPYGQRAIAAQFSRNEKVEILMKLKGLSCTRQNRGAIGALVFNADGAPGVQVRFGRIEVIFFGIGLCSRRIDPQRRYIDNLIEDAKVTVLSGLPKQ